MVAVAAGTAAPQTSAGDGEGWEFSVTPHVWTVSMKGTADFGDLDVPPLGSMADVETSVVVLDALGSYRITLTDSDVFDFLAGIRWTRSEVDVVVTEGPPDDGGAADDSWIDPLVGVRFSSRFSESWYSWVRMDVGGFGIGSDFTWGTSLGLGYEFNDTVAANLGYKHIGIDWDDGSTMYKGLTLVEHGLLLGVTFSF
jgi:opacity protein-like surface antigen